MDSFKILDIFFYFKDFLFLEILDIFFIFKDELTKNEHIVKCFINYALVDKLSNITK